MVLIMGCRPLSLAEQDRIFHKRSASFFFMAYGPHWHSQSLEFLSPTQSLQQFFALLLKTKNSQNKQSRFCSLESGDFRFCISMLCETHCLSAQIRRSFLSGVH